MARFFGKKEERYVADDSGDYLSIEESLSSKEEVNKDLEVRVFVLDEYENIRDILDVVRSEKTLCLIDIHLLRNKDPDELRRVVDKLKKTSEAIDGEVVGFHENWIMVSPKNIKIHKESN